MHFGILVDFSLDTDQKVLTLQLIDVRMQIFIARRVIHSLAFSVVPCRLVHTVSWDGEGEQDRFWYPLVSK